MNTVFKTKNRRPLTSIDLGMVPGPESYDDCKASVHEGFGDFLLLGVHPWGHMG